MMTHEDMLEELRQLTKLHIGDYIRQLSADELLSIVTPEVRLGLAKRLLDEITADELIAVITPEVRAELAQQLKDDGPTPPPPNP